LEGLPPKPVIIPPKPRRDAVPVNPDFGQFAVSLSEDLVGGGDLGRLAERARLVFGVGEVQLRDDRLDVEVTAAISAEWFAELLDLEDAFLVSGDVHQTRWAVKVKAGDVDDPYGPRIHVANPKVGPWELRIGVDRRPGGPLPGLVAGASPAYPVAGSAVLVTHVSVTLHRVG
jgi:hypothetical protein